jgi:hypothetical protein
VILKEEKPMAREDIHWSHPLKVTLQNGLVRRFENVYETLGFLESEWPLKRGEHYDRAVVMCRRTLARMTPPTVAREAFAAACREAGIAAETVGPRHGQPINRPAAAARKPRHDNGRFRRNGPGTRT